ncbi:MAG: SelT/SelW/SelH family protein [Bacteroidales bacterium]|nr:SelT/SelW/SelH family protein [Bacteroidales bacterium]
MNKLTITYCPRCNWLLRAAWMAQELMVTFDDELQSAELAKGPSGHFSIMVNGREVWDRKRQGGFPEITHVKQLIRDIIAPGKPLGHADKKNYGT